MLSFFFFQAEDGIRDADVTGVQTCALPIYDERLYKTPKEREEEARRDPILAFARVLQDRKVATAQFLEAMREEVDREIDAAVEAARAEARPDRATILTH